jgi:protein SHQ1
MHEKLFSGKRQLLKCLLDIHLLFNQSSPRYLLNRIYIEDYCVWIQGADDNWFAAMADEVGMVSSAVSVNITLCKVEG